MPKTVIPLALDTLQAAAACKLGIHPAYGWTGRQPTKYNAPTRYWIMREIMLHMIDGNEDAAVSAYWSELWDQITEQP